MNKPPLSVTVIGWLYIIGGAIGLAFQLGKIGYPIPSDMILVAVIDVAAIVFGWYTLGGQNWARWLALAWMAFHVILSVFHTVPELAIHSVFCAIVAYCLFRPAATRYFRLAKTPVTKNPGSSA